MLSNETLIPLILYTALLLVLTLLGLAASGHFPRGHHNPALALGSAILYGTIAVAMISLVAALFAAWRLIPWYAAIIGGGFAILVAPLVLQHFPDRFIDGRGSLLSFAGAGAVLALFLFWLATNRVASQ
jgi:MFS family permease